MILVLTKGTKESTMWLKWLPWRFVVRHVARAEGFIDPIAVISQAQRFSQPAEVAVPVELLRLGTALQARGLMNAQAFQHNLDWVWPYWVNRQFDPRDPAFIPRAFSMTQINLTHRNWTAVGFPGCSEYPIVDARGLVMPFYDSWSIDAWVVTEEKQDLVPSRMEGVLQELLLDGNWGVKTAVAREGLELVSSVWVESFEESRLPVLRLLIEGKADRKAWLAVSLRPYNPEGVSFVHDIEILRDPPGWRINRQKNLYFEQPWDRHVFSNYRQGDVYRTLPQAGTEEAMRCPIGLATAAALYELEPGKAREIMIRVPLGEQDAKRVFAAGAGESNFLWSENCKTSARLRITDKRFQFLYDASIRAMVLHSPGEIFPGPFTYKHFWFRDAVMIAYAMLCSGLTARAEKVIDQFFSRQTVTGYFHSQDGEWDSNGQVLWLLQKFCQMTNTAPLPKWKNSIVKAAKWIHRKRVNVNPESLHSGLFPAGFSAEHLGPNDFYYWDDFWGVQGLASAAWLLACLGEKEEAQKWRAESRSFFLCIEESLKKVAGNLRSEAVPASPYRRLDAGAIGSLAAGYPLRLWQEKDPRLLATADYLVRDCFMEGAFFHDISHSGLNPYLTLHVAEVLLRAGDSRFTEMLMSLMHMASRTGQWPEAIHPQTWGGCMGDGQHIWASAEWVIMMRNLFVREEENKLILGSGLAGFLTEKNSSLAWGPAPTEFGVVSVEVKRAGDDFHLDWNAQWYGEAPEIEVRLPEKAAV